MKFFVFTVLPFGLLSAPNIFTTVVRPLVKYCRFNSVKITCFLNDGIGIEYNYEEAKRKSEFVQETLTKSGFIPNIQKSTWEPCKILTWLRIDINLSSGTLKITKSRIDIILNTIYLILWKIFVSARTLAKLAVLLKLMSKGALRFRLYIQLICIFQQYRYNLKNQL